MHDPMTTNGPPAQPISEGPTGTLELERSQALLSRARETVAGGDSSSQRVGQGQLPTVIEAGDGAYKMDADGNRYLDLQAGYGPLLFGHRHPAVIEAVVRQARDSGTHFGMPHPLNAEVAELICELVPGVDLVRFSASGSEAALQGLRLARAATGRSTVLKFEGHYHGFSDSVSSKLHPSQAEVSVVQPGAPGQPAACLADLRLAPWNDEVALLEALDDGLAAVICEPIMANSGVIPPRPGYLELLRAETARRGIVLIFDEVITGFRVAAGGAAERYGVTPDLVIMAKALGGGLPLAALGGTRDLMDLYAERRATSGGTYAGSPIALAGAKATLQMILERRQDLYPRLDRVAEQLQDGFRQALRANGIPAVVQGVGSIFQVFMVSRPIDAIHDYRTAVANVLPERFTLWQHALQRHGVYVHPDQWELFFASAVMDDEDVRLAVQAAERAAAELYRGSLSESDDRALTSQDAGFADLSD